jgi:hypothetical protein
MSAAALLAQASPFVTRQNVAQCERQLKASDVNLTDPNSDPHPYIFKTYGGLVCARFGNTTFAGGFTYISLAAWDQRSAPLWIVRSDRGIVLTFPPFRAFLKDGKAYTLPPAEFKGGEDGKLRCMLRAVEGMSCAPAP